MEVGASGGDSLGDREARLSGAMEVNAGPTEMLHLGAMEATSVFGRGSDGEAAFGRRELGMETGRQLRRRWRRGFYPKSQAVTEKEGKATSHKSNSTREKGGEKRQSIHLVLNPISPPPKPSPFLGAAAARSHERLHLAASGSPPRSDFDRSADEFRPSSSRPASQCRTPLMQVCQAEYFRQLLKPVT
ncbi:hypothetical protein E2562_031652 [Oryza meyeriana var. granulata]|uniref:Uncharacterized protein n=1 Tax=Oryza meyeriana var. granulata TaxID=110450 RepID=A0A6G1E4T5_9ORYZ|nr:hypothetical protein E2562_031652 [Oryza meyeriana var. granulata]